jgi:TrpR family transcriptional regulator, trp operon repressor
MRNKNTFDTVAFERFCHALASMDSPSDIRRFLEEVLTENERLDVALRWHLLELLNEGVPQRKIAGQLGISLCKITRGSRILKDDRSVVREKLPAKKPRRKE